MVNAGNQATVKSVVWDLDDTVWSGVLLEVPLVEPHAWVPATISALDRRGIINSIASRNDFRLAERRLRESGLWEYFVYPQINWGPKSISVGRIAQLLNIGLDTIVVIDDDPFERAEISAALPLVRCVDAAAGASILDLPGMTPPHLTDAAARRRQFYQSEIARQEAEHDFPGPSQDFLASLGLRLSIAPATAADLDRAAELTVRTNQLNSTGVTYSRAELGAFIGSSRHLLLMVDLTDRFGDYGQIGLMLVEMEPAQWTIRLLLMSCRVASRGAGAIVLTQLRALASALGVKLRADFLRTDRNRLMLMTYRFGGFSEASRAGSLIVFEADLTDVPAPPPYVSVAFRGAGPWQEGCQRRSAT